MSINNKPIGIFDSGLGGLTLFKELKKTLPNEKFIYLGDIAHLPYGNKSNEAIIKYSIAISKFLLLKDIKCLIIACNTASSVAFKFLQKNFNIPIFNVIDPCIQEATQRTQTNQIAIIGTEATIHSNTYQKKIKKINKKIKVITQPCPLFVPIVEEGLSNHRIAFDVTQFYFKKIIKTKADTLILGCTHYPLMLNTIKKVTKDKLKIINSPAITANNISKYLICHAQQAKHTSPRRDCFYVTDKPDKFDYLAQKFLNKKHIEVNQIVLT